MKSTEDTIEPNPSSQFRGTRDPQGCAGLRDRWRWWLSGGDSGLTLAHEAPSAGDCALGGPPVLPTSCLCFRLGKNVTPPFWMAHYGLLNGDCTFQRLCYLFKHFCRLPVPIWTPRRREHIRPLTVDLQVARGRGDACQLEQRLCGTAWAPACPPSSCPAPRGCAAQMAAAPPAVLA